MLSLSLLLHPILCDQTNELGASLYCTDLNPQNSVNIGEVCMMYGIHPTENDSGTFR